MRVEEALGMMRHYFGSDCVTAGVEARLRAVFVDDTLSPAELETMCADFDTPVELIDELARRFGLAVATRVASFGASAVGVLTEAKAGSATPPDTSAFVKVF
jgi:hypothetical protein